MGMVDISNKKIINRFAQSEGKLKLKKGTIKAIKEGKIKKGEPCKTAEIAALLAIKSVPSIIPHCHPVPITSANISFKIKGNVLTCTCGVKADCKTGVEMEALTGVVTALLTIWDMVKYLEKNEYGQYIETEMYGIRVTEKVKGC